MLNKFILAKSEKKQSIFKTMRDKLYDNLYDGMIMIREEKVTKSGRVSCKPTIIPVELLW